MKRQPPIAVWVGGGAAALGAAWWARRRWAPDFCHRSVLITGGARGLGLALARQFAAEGARLTLVARHAGALECARRELTASGCDHVLTHACDLRDRRQAREAVAAAMARYGALDVLVNNAGIIQVGPAVHMSLDDFEDAMATHLWAAYYMIEAALPQMRAQGEGRIVNIVSIGGRIAVPHMLPYTASKFALSGFSQGLSAELARENIAVTTVYPGLMRTGSHVNAYFKGQHEREFAWFSILAGMPGLSIDAGRAARKIVEASRRRRPELIITAPARAAVVVEALAPSWFARALRAVNRLLPAPGEDHETRLGWDSMSAWSPSVLTEAADAAIEAHNQYRSVA